MEDNSPMDWRCWCGGRVGFRIIQVHYLARGIGARGSPGTGERGASGSYEDAGSGGGAGLRIPEVGASAWARRGAGRTVEWRWGAGDPHFRTREAAEEPAMAPTRSLL